MNCKVQKALQSHGQQCRIHGWMTSADALKGFVPYPCDRRSRKNALWVVSMIFTALRPLDGLFYYLAALQQITEMMTENGILNRKQFYYHQHLFSSLLFSRCFQFCKEKNVFVCHQERPLFFLALYSKNSHQLRNAKTRLKRGIHLDEKQEIYLVCRHFYKRKLQENKLFHCVAK